MQCVTEDCDKAATKRDRCPKHYMRWYRETRTPPRIKDKVVCLVNYCHRPPKAQGLCASHYARAYRGQDLDTPMRVRIEAPHCTAEDCERPIHGGGLCTTHYWRERKGKTLTAPIRERAAREGTCTVDGCDRELQARDGGADGLCTRHYARRQDGEPDWKRPINPKAANGEGHLNDDGYRKLAP